MHRRLPVKRRVIDREIDWLLKGLTGLRRTIRKRRFASTLNFGKVETKGPLRSRLCRPSRPGTAKTRYVSPWTLVKGSPRRDGRARPKTSKRRRLKTQQGGMKRPQTSPIPRRSDRTRLASELHATHEIDSSLLSGLDYIDELNFPGTKAPQAAAVVEARQVPKAVTVVRPRRRVQMMSKNDAIKLKNELLRLKIDVYVSGFDVARKKYPKPRILKLSAQLAEYKRCCDKYRLQSDRFIKMPSVPFLPLLL